MMTQTEREPYIYIKIIPGSLYASFATVDVKIYPNREISTCSVRFPSKYSIISAEVKGEKIEINSSKVAITHLSGEEGEISFKLKIDKAIEDSGDVNFPLISAKLQIDFLLEVEPKTQHAMRVHICFPVGCKGYVNYSNIKIGDQEYRFGGEHQLNHLTDGYPETIVSYYTPSIRGAQSTTKVEIETYYSPSFLLFLPSLLFPSMLGLPVIAIWAYPGLDCIQRLLLTIPIFSIIFTIWYKTAPVGMGRLSCLLNHTYVFWALVWTLYAVAFEIFGINVSMVSFLPYLLLIIITLFQLYHFYRHPTQKSKPWIIKLNGFISPWDRIIGEKFIDKLVRHSKK